MGTAFYISSVEIADAVRHDYAGGVTEEEIRTKWKYYLESLQRDFLKVVEMTLDDLHSEELRLVDEAWVDYNLSKRQEDQMKAVIVYFGDDWVGLYWNGKLVLEDHSLKPRAVLEALNVAVETKSVSDKDVEDLYDWQMPQYLNNIS